MKDLDHIKLYTGGEQDILKRPPSFLVKAGTYLICFTLAGIFLLSQYILFPDKASAELTIQKNQIGYLTASHDTIVWRKERGNFLRKGEIIACYGRVEDAGGPKDTTSEADEKSAIVSPWEGYLLETSRPALSFVNKGDTLFGILPVEQSAIEASFVLPTRYKKELEAEAGNLLTLDGGDGSYSFNVLKITPIGKERIEVRIHTDPALAAYFYPAEDGSYRLFAEIWIHPQSLWNRLVGAILPKGW